MKLTANYYQADSSNYTKGRDGRSIKYFTIHHTVGYETTLRYLWQNPARNGSSHFFAHPNYFEQYVDTDDTAWTNRNWNSNCESITCETRGDWRNGYYDQATLNTLAEIMYQCLKHYPNLGLTYHQDVSDKYTECPADLKHKSYALNAWNIAKNRIKVETAPVPANLRIDIPDKKVILIRDTNVWDMSFTSFANAKAVVALPKGTVIDVAGIYDHPLSKVDYYLSNYSWNKGLNNGISIADCEDYKEPTPPSLPPETVPEPPNPVVPLPDHPKGGAGELPPLPVDPNGELIVENNSLLKKILAILEWIKIKLEGVFK